MASNAQTLETLAASLGYHGLSSRDLLICLVASFAVATNLTAQQAINQAKAAGYSALSDELLNDAILAIIT
jgi:hypothetical protein